MKKVLQIILAVVFVVGIAAYLIITAVADLTNTADLHTVTLDGAYESVYVEHSINGLIPTGTDHYYVGFDFEKSEAYIIHASPGWLSENFDEEGYAISPEGVVLTSLVKPLNDYDLKKELASRTADINWADFVYGKNSCFELSYQLVAVLKLVLVVLIAVLAVFGWYIVKNRQVVNKVLSILYVLLLLAAVIILLFVIR